MTKSSDEWVRERAIQRIKEKEERLKILEKDFDRNKEEIEQIKDSLKTDYELAYGRD